LLIASSRGMICLYSSGPWPAPIFFTLLWAGRQ
jgi:hypothetical protein